MQLLRSEKAKTELASRERLLTVRERAALLLADGNKTRDEMQRLLQDDGGLIAKLMAEGYLLSIARGSKAPTAGNPIAAPMPVTPVAAAPAAPAPQPAPAAPQATGDNFEGKRSLATTRMFLFDICERMFVRKMPSLATHYRDQLREARDRESMMAIARDIILNVEEIAGAERADGLSERIAMLLPPE